jgi:hypothetical protein
MTKSVRRSLFALLCFATGAILIGVSPTAALADPSPSSPHQITGTSTIRGNANGVATFTRAKDGNAVPLQNPPDGGCNIYNVHSSWSAHYNGSNILDQLVTTFGSSITCTATAAGQSMAALSTQATLWHNGQPVGSTGKPSACGNCNSIATPNAVVGCSGTPCAGSYFASADQLLQLPGGWTWSSWPSSCLTPLPQTPGTLECIELTNTYFISAAL